MMAMTVRSSIRVNPGERGLEADGGELMVGTGFDVDGIDTGTASTIKHRSVLTTTLKKGYS